MIKLIRHAAADVKITEGCRKCWRRLKTIVPSTSPSCVQALPMSSRE
ncbi:hypothetical protein [Mangrovibacterium diazotrophicum]|nr:hypothetical protein [Mangrovibacterium diazotrophicum]